MWVIVRSRMITNHTDPTAAPGPYKELCTDSQGNVVSFATEKEARARVGLWRCLDRIWHYEPTHVNLQTPPWQKPGTSPPATHPN